MFYVIYNTQSGTLLEITETMPDAQPAELAIKVFDIPIPDLYMYHWDKAQLNFIPNVDANRVLTKLQFRRRFTDSERVSIDTFNSTYLTSTILTDTQKAIIRSGLEDYNIANDINLDDPGTTTMLNLYASLGLIAPARIQEIIMK